MIPIQILDERHNVKTESKNDGMNLEIQGSTNVEGIVILCRTYLPSSRKKINHLLNSTSAMHIQRYIDQFLCDRFTDKVALFICREFQQLLAEVVTERI